MLDKKDLEALKGAKAKGLTLDQVIESAENILELENKKKEYKKIISIIADYSTEYIDENIEEIEKQENKLDFIIKKSFEIYQQEKLKLAEQEIEAKL